MTAVHNPLQVREVEMNSEPSLRCILNPQRNCTQPDFEPTEPYVFLIYPKQWSRRMQSFKTIIENSVKVKIGENAVDLRAKGFEDFERIHGSTFCNRVCKPIQQSEFCLAICRHNEEKIKSTCEKLGGKIEFKIYVPNENVWWEVGIAMGFRKSVIVFIGKGQKMPSDFYNNISTQILGSRSQNTEKLKAIFNDPTNFGGRMIWEEQRS